MFDADEARKLSYESLQKSKTALDEISLKAKELRENQAIELQAEIHRVVPLLVANILGQIKAEASPARTFHLKIPSGYTGQQLSAFWEAFPEELQTNIHISDKDTKTIMRLVCKELKSLKFDAGYDYSVIPGYGIDDYDHHYLDFWVTW